MTSTRWIFGGSAAAMLPVSSVILLAQLSAAGAAPAQRAKPAMSFFVTSVGKGDGANLGGLAGADAHCQTLAAAVGRGTATWRAYLSTQGPNAVNARDRIGTGPWYNAKGELVARDAADLHARSAAGGAMLAIDEKGEVIPGEGQTPNLHDVMTGTQPDGRAFTDNADHTCSGWTSGTTGAVQMGHADRLDRESNGKPTSSWNSAHPRAAPIAVSKGCAPPTWARDCSIASPSSDAAGGASHPGPIHRRSRGRET